MKQHVLRLHNSKQPSQNIDQSIGIVETSQVKKREFITLVETPILLLKNRQPVQNKENITEERASDEDADNDFIKDIIGNIF